MRRRAGAQRATVYKLCSLALQYPDAELLSGRHELAAAAADLTDGRQAASLQCFFAWFTSAPPVELAQHYVQTFDLGKRSALYLTFYSAGDRRDRGLVLLRLKKLYRAAGLPLESSELPDYLPVMLEFAAAAAPDQADLVLSEHRAALELIRLSLREQHSPYADVLDAVCSRLGGLSATERLSFDRLIAQGPPQELVGLEPFAPPEVMPTTGGVPGTDVEIGGGSPVLEPDRGNPTSKARARPGIDRAVPVRPGLALRGFREGGSEGGGRCVVVANESEAP